MRALYFDAFSGISGDMTVGAFLSLGLPVEYLRDQLLRLPLSHYQIAVTPRSVHGISATKFDVLEDATSHSHEHHHRRYGDIRAMIESAPLEPPVSRVALDIFAALAKAEGRIHGVDPEAVAFHEVGALDSIVDIVATAVGIHAFEVDQVFVSPLPMGSGIIRSQHGPIPVPAPATAELLKGFATRIGDGAGEMVTPTGAAIVAALARPGGVPPLQIVNVGYGSGTRTLEDRPNVLRLVLGEIAGEGRNESLVVLETNIDDLNPEIYEFVMERLFEAGARDVVLVPIHMKKNRPGVLLSVLCDESARESLSEIVLQETSAIGLRYHRVERTILPREVVAVATSYGPVRVKISVGPAGHRNVAPEYEDCKRLAREHDVPLKLVYQEATMAARAAG